MRWTWMAAAACACACGGDKPDYLADTGWEPPQGDSAVDSGSSVPPVPVEVTARLLDPISSRGLSELAVSDVQGAASCTTDADGECSLSVTGSSSFHLSVTGDNVLEHRLFGPAGAEDFTTISFIANARLTDQVYSLLRVSRDSTKGTVVVGLDRPNLSPATGASAAIDGSADVTFVFGASLPEAGDTLVAGGSSIVTFVNVPPGPVTVTATGAEDTTCLAAPARTDAAHTVESVAGAVSVVTFICE